MTIDTIDPLAQAAVTPALQRAVWAMCTAVPGLMPRAIDLAPALPDADAMVGVTMEGWSPTLNACKIQFAGRPDPNAQDLDHAVLGMLAPFVAEQARRAADAMASGIGMPVETSTPARPAVAHLHADATHLAMAIRAAVAKAMQGPAWSDDGCHDGDPMDDPSIVDEILRKAIATISLSHNGNARPYDGGPVISSSGCVAMQHVMGDGRTICCLGMGSESMPAGQNIILVGNDGSGNTRASIARSGLPDSALVILAGRAFDEVFEMPPFLAQTLGPRRMGTVTDRGDTIFITMEPLYASLADVSGRTPREAIDLLQAVIRTGRS